MALQKDITLDIGLETKAYYKVDTISLDYKNKRFHISLSTYINKKARDDIKQPLLTKQYDANAGMGMFPLEYQNGKFDLYFSCAVMDIEGNTVKQAYAFLKTLDEFVGAEDI